jgi:kynurenine 3-monooxygenase
LLRFWQALLMRLNIKVDNKDEHIIIIGAGLAGCLLAIYLRKEGFSVAVFEKRIDPRSTSIAEGRSINLALSHRGIHALLKADVFAEVKDSLLPMKGRMIHGSQGSLTEQLYGIEGQAINSVGRNDLNKALINKAEGLGVVFHFNHKCEQVDLRKTTLTVSENGKYKNFTGSALFGADGAFSVMKQAMLRLDRFNYSQAYISHGYKEIAMPGAAGTFQMSPNHLHIWPRGSYMLIALPNPNHTFTCTLFYPHQGFDQLQSNEQIEKLFNDQFPDVPEKIPDLTRQFKLNPTSSLMTVRTGPWYAGNCLLIGDAAHAIVPFYGQGMNAAFEDCRILIEIARSNEFNWKNTFHEFFSSRKKDADAIADLALANFIEMRDHVADELFLDRKKRDADLHKVYGEEWVPMYTSVTFRDTPYHEAQALGHIQEQVLKRAQREGKLLDDNYCFSLRKEMLGG